MNEPDRLLSEVIAQAKSVNIPVCAEISPKVIINRRAKTRFGCCKPVPGGCVIELSEKMLAAPEKSCREVLAHEILHSCYGCRNHGKRWQRYAAIMNERFGYDIKRTHSFEEMGLCDDRRLKYAVICKGCGRIIRRMKKSPLILTPWRYRCRCGGALQLLKED